ncbi:MAG: DNA polymerase III subunit delta [Pseudomonadales bacterium]|nr:DNA polymerase III subunit delta [Pseudomonadales bacterium]MCP5358673.1 DNA polymerase III subunit delta [Pseudomonadales bacterium]
MRINADQLDAHTRSQLGGFYWIAGDDTLLVQESLTLLRKRCREAGFTEWELFFVDKGFDWQALLQSSNSMSLFADRRILELRLQAGKLDDAGKAALKQALQSPNPDNVLILVTPRVEPASLNTQWFKGLESSGTFVTVWPINADRLPGWILGRMKTVGLTADRDAIAILADRVEGNLLAADQEIQKLAVLTGAETGKPVHLERKHVMSLVADSARYNTFNLMDAALLGDARRCIKVLNGLKTEGAELLMILGALSADLRRLIAIAEQLQQGHRLTDALKREGIKRNHEQAISAAARRHALSALQDMLRQVRQIDMAAKGMSPADPWVELSQLLLQLAGHHILPRSMLS